MPNATIDPAHYEREDLKSLEGAYVMVRPLPYGMVLTRRDKATKMYMEANPSRGRRKAEEEVQRFELATLNEWATAFDFSYCIGEHNLTDVNDNQIDFSTAANVQMALQILNPRVGAEIEKILSELNGSDEDEDMDAFIKRHTTISPDGKTDSTLESVPS